MDDDAESFWCCDCGAEMFAEDVAAAVVQTGAFSGRCVTCVEDASRQGERITTWT